ncbi:MAG: hypothetical protein LBU22_02875 [Dysgonamonadaceae bacterium]|nr:hypothetical protein [Dysgonamonadaceae bacterium]
MSAQQFNYNQRWKEIAQLSEQGNVKSLLPKVEAILQQAKTDGNTVEIINSLIYKEQILTQTQEDPENDAWKIAITDFETMISQVSDAVTKSVLQSLVAKTYENYAHATQWKRRSITETENPPADIAEWTTARLLRKSFDLYCLSVENSAMLEKEKTEKFKKILTSNEDIDLFPTLYDILMYRYYQALRNADSRGILPYSQDTKTKKFDVSESDILLNKLIKFHENDENKSAYLNFTFYALENFKIDETDKAEQILKLADEYKQEPFSTYLYYKAAEIYSKNGEKKRAYEICVGAKNLLPLQTNKWAENLKTLIAELERQYLQISIDQYNLPDAAIAVQIAATNCDKVFYRIIKITESIVGKDLKQTSGAVVKSGAWELRKFDDFLAHSTIVALDGLLQGKYEIEVANNQQFAKAKQGAENAMEKLQFSVNNWVIVNLQQNQYQILNRKTGEPIKNLPVKLFRIDYRQSRKYFEIPNSKTNENGIFFVPKSENYRADLSIYIPDAKSFIDLGYNYYNDGKDSVTEEVIDFFTDRAIYRPGQTVYFKGILYNKNKNKSEIAKKEKITIELYNPNYEKVSELELTSNDYGSVFGEFILPQNGLTGDYNLESDFADNEYHFRVEEYKRPKFEVKMDSLSGEFVLDKEVKTTGKAESYAGAAISEAKVVYRVERQEIFPYRYWWLPPVNAQNETITQGETATDGEGKFEISFTAKPKNDREKGEYRTYTYKITADVTDINGETHSTTQSVTIGDLPRKLELKIPEKALQKDFSKVKIASSNLNNVPEHSKGTIKITQLLSPDRIILPDKIGITRVENFRYQQNTSNNFYQIYSAQEFVKFFPHLPYSADETQPESWKHGKTFEYQFNTEKSDSVNVKTLSKGFYLIEAISLFNTDTIKVAKVLEILDDKTLKSTDNAFFQARSDKTAYFAGDKITLSFVSDIKNAVAVVHIESGGKWIEHKEIPLNVETGHAPSLQIDARPEYIADGLFVSSYLVWENGYQQQNFTVSVKDKPKNLKISTKTFRDKLQPGQPETWELVVSGEDKDKLTAEVLATMYDASLDAFAVNSFSFNPFHHFPYGRLWQSTNFYNQYNSINAYVSPYYVGRIIHYPQFPNLQDFDIYGGSYRVNKMLSNRIAGIALAENFNDIAELDEVVVVGYGTDKKHSVMGAVVSVNNAEFEGEGHVDGAPSEAPPFAINIAHPTIQIRKNLQETAFFYPNLYTDPNGDVRISFTSPEALTKWKLLLLAHTQDLYSGTAEFYAQTQKELMVVPNLPRFLREGDEVVISAKINNLSEKNLAGSAKLELFDGFTGKTLKISLQEQIFSTETNKNAEISWRFTVPTVPQIIEYKIIATANEFSDGEGGVIPVLPNRMLVTETMPIFAKEGQTKTFMFEKMVNPAVIETGRTPSLQNHRLTLELTTNPLWLAVLSLPYLREYPYECSEQLFSRLYGNILSTHILNQNPKIKSVFDEWMKNLPSFENLASLESNEELKNILLEETPWVREAQDENEQKKRLALFFDLNKMSQEFAAAQQKLIQRQNADGGFAWFDGGQSSVYITEHIILGFGQLQKMLGEEYKNFPSFQNLESLTAKAIKYIDNEKIKEIKRRKAVEIKMNIYTMNGKELMHYYYVRSFWKEKFPLPDETAKYAGDLNQDIRLYFKDYDLQNKAMTAVVLKRYGFEKSAKTIVDNLKETAVEADEMGMYWKDNRAGWLWYQSPVEAQAKAIEAFDEITPQDVKSIEEMKIWLLKNRQTNAWNSTKATTDAVYALMNFGKDWTNAEEGVKVFVGGQNLNVLRDVNDLKVPVETASGYIKQSWKAQQISPEMGTVKIEKTSPGTAWGGMYWQYFEDLDKITSADSNVKIEKQLFVKKNTDKGLILTEITDKTPINVGDLVSIRLTIHIDRDMEYIHIKDMRAAGFEPVNVLSGYKYQNGAAYYESTRDVATNFFFERMTAGAYVFEYDVRANNAGVFSNGITTLQNMYAPEMSCHSEGIKVEITNYEK